MQGEEGREETLSRKGPFLPFAPCAVRRLIRLAPVNELLGGFAAAYAYIGDVLLI